MVCGYLISFSIDLNAEVAPVLGAACAVCGCVAMFPGCGVALLPARPVDLRARGEGVVEYPGKVACPSGRRCSTRNAVWCHSHPGFKSQRYRHCRPAPVGPGGFVMPTWCVVLPCAVWPRWCSGRRRARPPARLGGLTSFGAAPRSPPVPSGPSGALHTSGACRCEWSAWPGPAATHRHRGRSLRCPPAPSTPVVLGVLACGWTRRLVVRPGPAVAHGCRSLSPT